MIELTSNPFGMRLHFICIQLSGEIRVGTIFLWPRLTHWIWVAFFNTHTYTHACTPDVQFIRNATKIISFLRTYVCVCASLTALMLIQMGYFYTCMIDINDRTNEKLNSSWHGWTFVSEALWKQIEWKRKQQRQSKTPWPMIIKDLSCDRWQCGSLKSFKLIILKIAMNFHSRDDKMCMIVMYRHIGKTCENRRQTS